LFLSLHMRTRRGILGEIFRHAGRRVLERAPQRAVTTGEQ
jgi:hypothetical protein